MRRILALDFGQKRIGLALSDGEMISGYETIVYRQLDEALQKVGQICRKEAIEAMVIGIPRNKETLQAQKIHKFAIELAKNLNLPIHYVDESLTSKEAERILANSNLDPKSEKYKREIDKLSAKMILEQYIRNKV